MLEIVIGFYRLGKVLFAPNQELVDMLADRTRRPTKLMTRGIDSILFHPSKRRACDGVFRPGFVGRVTPEKSVRMFARVEQALLQRGLNNFRFLIVGDGSEREWLRQNLRHADLPGILRGDDQEFVERTVELIEDRPRLCRMRQAGLAQVAGASWDRVFEQVYEGYAAAPA